DASILVRRDVRRDDAAQWRLIPIGRTVDSNVNRRDAAGRASPSLLGGGGGDDSRDHTVGDVGGGAAQFGSTDAGCESGASDAGDWLGAGRLVARGCGRGLRDGPSDAARLGAPLQRVGTGGSVRTAAPQRAAAPLDGRTAGQSGGMGGQTVAQAVVPACVGASAAPAEQTRGTGGFQRSFADLVTAALP